MLVALRMSACQHLGRTVRNRLRFRRSSGPHRNLAPGVFVSRAEDVAALPAAVAGVVLPAFLVERDDELRGTLGALHAWPGRRGVGRARRRSESNSQRGLHGSPVRNRDRGPVGALDAVDVVVVSGIDVTPASGTRLQQDQSLHSSRRRLIFGSLRLFVILVTKNLISKSRPGSPEGQTPLARGLRDVPPRAKTLRAGGWEYGICLFEIVAKGHPLNIAVWHYTLLRTYVSILDGSRRLPDGRRCTTILLVSGTYPQGKRGSRGTSDDGH